MSINPLKDRPFMIPRDSAPQISDRVLRLMIQAARHGKLEVRFQLVKGQGVLGTGYDQDGIEHRRATVKSWGARSMFDWKWRDDGEYQVAIVELTDNGVKWLQYLRELLAEVPL